MLRRISLTRPIRGVPHMNRALACGIVVIVLVAGGRIDAQTLPNRVAAGDVTAFSAVVWARATAPGIVTFDISVHSDFQAPVQHRFDWVLSVARPAKAIAGPLLP